MFKTLKKSNDNWKVFPNIKDLAYYSFFTQSVHLTSVEQGDINELIEFVIARKGEIDYRQYELLRKTLAVLHHEYTHWVDNISTIWGTDLLLRVFEAFKLRSDEIDETDGIGLSAEYYKIKELRDLSKRITYSDYYTTRYNVENKYPWIASYSIGRLFAKSGKLSEYPIFFTRFTTHQDKQLICRVPFSLSSILESSAMSQEFYIDHFALSLLSEDSKYVELALYKKEMLSTIYNQNLCVYNVAAHHIANCAGISDISLAYRVCGILGRFVLNFPSSLFAKINVPAEHIEKITKGEHNDIWLQGYKVAFEHKDRGILFFLIGSLLSKIENPESVTDAQIIRMFNNALPLINVKCEDVEKEARFEIIMNYKKLEEFDNPMSHYIAQTGQMLFDKLKIFGEYPYKFHEFSPIPAILGDDSIFQPYGKPEELNFNFLEYIYKSMSLEPYIREFEEACIF